MHTTLRLAPAPRLSWMLLMAVALLLAIAAAAVFVGGRPGPAPITGIARNGPLIYGENGDIYRFDPATGAKTPLITGPEDDSSPQFSRDGRSFAFERRNGEPNPTLFIADADGTHPRPVAGPLVEQTWGDWSPDGSRFAIVSNVDGATRITIASADGSGSHVLGVNDVGTSASWLGPDGDELLFDRDTGRIGLYVVPADGSAAPRLLDADLPPNPDSFQHVAVSLDGSRVAYDSFEQSAWQPATGERTAGWDGMLQQLHVLNVVTGEDVVIPPPTDPLISSQPVDMSAPVFSADGRTLLFLLDRSDGGMELGTAPADGSSPGHSLGPVKVWGQEWPSYEVHPGREAGDRGLYRRGRCAPVADRRRGRHDNPEGHRRRPGNAATRPLITRALAGRFALTASRPSTYPMRG